MYEYIRKICHLNGTMSFDNIMNCTVDKKSKGNANFLVLFTKQYIYRKKCQNDTPTITELKALLRRREILEKINCKTEKEKNTHEKNGYKSTIMEGKGMPVGSI